MRKGGLSFRMFRIPRTEAISVDKETGSLARDHFGVVSGAKCEHARMNLWSIPPDANPRTPLRTMVSSPGGGGLFILLQRRKPGVADPALGELSHPHPASDSHAHRRAD